MMVLITVVKITIVACTFVGNLFVIIAILIDKNLQTPANQLVLSLAVADLMVGCLVMPLGTYNDYHEGWWLGEEVCEFYTSADVLCCTASILNLLAIALDRYWAVTNVDYIYRRTWKRVTLMIVCAWTVGAIVSLAPIFGWKDPDFVRRVLEDHKCLVSQDVGYQIFATISTFYAPLVLLLALYWRIFKVARKRIHCKPGRKSGGPQQLVATTSSSMFIGTGVSASDKAVAANPQTSSLAAARAQLCDQNHCKHNRTRTSKVGQTIESIAQQGAEAKADKATTTTTSIAGHLDGLRTAQEADNLAIEHGKQDDNFEQLCANSSAGGSSGAFGKTGDLTNLNVAANRPDEGAAFACTAERRQRVANDRNNGPNEQEPRLKGVRRFETESRLTTTAAVRMNEKQICLPPGQRAHVSMHHLGLSSPSEVATAANNARNSQGNHQQGDQFLSRTARKLAGLSGKEEDERELADEEEPRRRHYDGAHLKRDRLGRSDDRLKVWSSLRSPPTLAIQRRRTKPAACADDVLRLLQRCAAGPNPPRGVKTGRQPLATSFQTTGADNNNNQRRQRQRWRMGYDDKLLSSVSHLADQSANVRPNAGGSCEGSSSLCCHNNHYEEHHHLDQQQQQQRARPRELAEMRRSLVQLDAQMLTASGNNIGLAANGQQQQQSMSNSLSECGHCCCCLNATERTSGGLTSDDDFDEHNQNDEVLELREVDGANHLVSRTMISLSQQADAAAAWRSGRFQSDEFLSLSDDKKLAPAWHHCRQGSRSLFGAADGRMSPMVEPGPEQAIAWRAMSSMSNSSSSSATSLASSSPSSRSILAAAAAAELDHQDFHQHQQHDELVSDCGQTLHGAGGVTHKQCDDEPATRSDLFRPDLAERKRPISLQTQLEPLDPQVLSQPTGVITKAPNSAELEDEARSTSAKSTRTSAISRRFKALGQLVSFVQTSRQFNSSSSAQTSQSGDEQEPETTASEQKQTGNRNYNDDRGDHVRQHDESTLKRTFEMQVAVEPICDTTTRAANKDKHLVGGELKRGVSLRASETETKVDSLPAALMTADVDNQLAELAAGNALGRVATPLALKSVTSLPPQPSQVPPLAAAAKSQPQSMRADQFGTKPTSSAQQRRQNLEMKREKKAAKTLAIITGVFVCCWLPFFLNAIVMPICGELCTPSDLILSVLLWLGYLNSLLNPIIYTIFSPDFRRAFHRLLCWPDRSKSGRRSGGKTANELATIKQRAGSKVVALSGRLA